MSRRDTIIIAVLVNAGLLVVLFTTALKSDRTEPEIAANSAPQAPKVAELALPKESPLPKDEVDQVLSQFPPSTTASTPATLAKKEAGPAPLNFADDLKALSQPETASGFQAAGAPSLPNETVSFAVEKPAASLSEVRVKKGDVLEKIARVNHTTVEEIMKANHLTNTRLKIGQVLKIPGKGAVAKSSSGEQNKTESEQGAKYYTVKKGDSPWTISVKNHIKVEELLKLNNLDEEKARRLKAGDKLRIR